MLPSKDPSVIYHYVALYVCLLTSGISGKCKDDLVLYLSSILFGGYGLQSIFNMFIFCVLEFNRESKATAQYLYLAAKRR